MTYVVAPRTGYVYDDEAAAVYVASLPDGPLLVLSDSAALIWWAAVGRLASGHGQVDASAADQEEPPGDIDAVTRRVSECVGVAADEIRRDVATFLGEMVRRGLLAEEQPMTERRDGG